MSCTPGEGRSLSAEELNTLDPEAVLRFFGFGVASEVIEVTWEMIVGYP